MMVLAEMLAELGPVDGFGPDDLFWWAGGIGACLAVLAGFAVAIRAAFRCIHQLVHLAQKNDKDMAALKASVDVNTTSLLQVRAQVLPNGGTSMRDALTRVEQLQQKADQRAAGIAAKAEALAVDVAQIKGTLSALHDRG